MRRRDEIRRGGGGRRTRPNNELSNIRNRQEIMTDSDRGEEMKREKIIRTTLPRDTYEQKRRDSDRQRKRRGGEINKDGNRSDS